MFSEMPTGKLTEAVGDRNQMPKLASLRGYVNGRGEMNR
jgi:hypothetical protein